MVGSRFLVMLKPEANQRGIDTRGVAQLVRGQFARNQVNVLDRVELTGAMLRAKRVLDNVYLRLTLVAREGADALTDAERNSLAREMGDARVLSADETCIEFGLSASAVCEEGDRARVVKLGPGAYAAYLPRRQRVVLNHFVPEFRERYYDDIATVVAFECATSEPNLHQTRESLIGDIRPDLARVGTLRAELFAHAGDLRLGEVTVARNFLHMSPGHLEALYQLAHLFPAGGSFENRLVDRGILLDRERRQILADRATVARLFAETEHMSIEGAAHVLAGWRT